MASMHFSNTLWRFSKSPQLEIVISPQSTIDYWKINSYSVGIQSQKIEAPYNHICDLGARFGYERV